MTKEEAILAIQNRYDVNHVFAHHIASKSRHSNLFEDASRIISEKPKPFVKWVGGKRQLLAQFKENNLYPPREFDPSRGKYFEPFVGGGAVFFDLRPIRAALSDMNWELITTYKVIRDDVASLVADLKKHQLDKSYFLELRSVNPSTLTDLEVASRFLYLNKSCFNGMYRVNSSGGFNVPFANNKTPLFFDEENLIKVSDSLSGIEIIHQDFHKALERASKGDFVYFDPPYHPVSSTAYFTSYTKENFSQDNQIELRDLFLKLHLRGCYVMLSNSNTEFIRSIYGDLSKFGVKINEVQAGRSINSNGVKRGKVSEIVVTNY